MAIEDGTRDTASEEGVAVGETTDKLSGDIGDATGNPEPEAKPGEPIRQANGRFMKGSPPPKGVGRKKGIANRFNRTIKMTFESVFADMQKDKKLNLYAWAAENPSDFYRLANKLVEKSIDIKADVKHGVDPASLDLLDIARRMAFVLLEARRLRGKDADKDVLAITAQSERVHDSLVVTAAVPTYREVEPDPLPEEPTISEPELIHDEALHLSLAHERAEIFTDAKPFQVITTARWRR